jgi:PPM family protein phosphatase
MRFTIFSDSKVGDRTGNEDRVAYSYGKDVLMMVIADGMGGHHGGEIASEIAVQEITQRFQQEGRAKLKRPFEFLLNAIQGAHRAIVAHAGDSRLYVLRRGRLVASTQDHSKVQQLIDSGKITPEQAARHPDRNKIFSCLGGVVPPAIDLGTEVKMEPGDTVILSTDGFWAQIPANILGQMLTQKTLPALMPGLLNEAHRRAGGESDNISVVAMTWENQDDARVADTESLADTEFATDTNTTQQLGDGVPSDDVTEDEIERAIAEIQSAIKKVPR